MSTKTFQDHLGNWLDLDVTSSAFLVNTQVWDTNALTWVKATQAGGGAGGNSTIADGGDVAEGSTNDAAWSGSGAGTVISILKKIANAGGSAVSVADGSDVAEGSTTDVAVTSDVNGTISAKLRGLVKIFANVWDSGNSRLNVAVQNTPAVTNANLDVALSTRLKPADTLTKVSTVDTITNAVTVSQGTGSNLHTVIDSGSVTVNTISNFATESGGNLATVASNTGRIPAQGSALTSASMPVNIASDQTIPVSVSSLPLPSNAAKETGGILEKLELMSLQNEQIIKLLCVANFALSSIAGVKIDPDDAYQVSSIH